MHGVWTGIVEDIGDMTPGESARLEPGDLLVLYTDGITEARNAEGQMFGDARLQLAIEELHEGPSASFESACSAAPWRGCIARTTT